MKYIILIIFIITNIIANPPNNIEFLNIFYNKNIIKKIDKNKDNYSKILKDELIKKIKNKKFKPIELNYGKKISFLETRILNNKKYDNNIAIARDQIIIEKYYNRIIFNTLINELHQNYLKFKNKETIKTIILDNTNQLTQNKIDIYQEMFIKYNKLNSNNKVIINFLKEYKESQNEYKYISFLSQSLKHNISKLIQKKEIDFLNIKSLILFLDTHIHFYKFNEYFKYYFKSSLSLFIIAFFMMIIINLIYFVLKYIIIYLLNKKFISDKEEVIELKEYLIKLINKGALLVVFLYSIDVFLKIFNLNNNYNNPYFSLIYIISFVYIIYSISNYIISYSSEKFFIKYPNVKKDMVGFLLKTFKLVVISLTLLIILSKLGFDIKALLASFGVGGIAVALASKDTLSNLFGSITIMLDNSYEQGDWIETSTYEGTVIEIKMRTTTIRTFDNAYVTIPNSVLANSSIKNYSKRKIGRRIKMKLSVTYESKMDDILKSIDDIKEYLTNNSNIATEKTIYNINKKSSKLIKKEDAVGVKRTLMVFLDSYNESSIDILIYAFSRTVKWDEWLFVKQEVLIEINNIFKRNNIEFAYPTITNYLK